MRPSLAIGTTRAKRNRVLFILALLALLAVPTVAVADEGQPAQEALGALQLVPGVVAASEDAATGSDGDSALVVGTDDAVDVPTDPAAGVTLAPDNGAAIAIGIPGAAEATDAEAVADGIVVYEGTAVDTDTAVQVLDGSDSSSGVGHAVGARILTVMYADDAPSDFEFPLEVGDGGRVEPAGDAFVVLNERGEVTARIAPAWARDARGDAVPATLTLDGTTLRLHVEHVGAAYPVVADPAALLDDGPIVGPPPPTTSTSAPTTTAPIPTVDAPPATTTSPPLVPRVSTDDPDAFLTLVSKLLAGGDDGTRLWTTLTAEMRDAVLAFVSGGYMDVATWTSATESLASPALANPSLGRCRLAGYTLKYKTRFGITLWTFAAGFQFCANGVAVTYVSDPIIRASAHWGWDYHGVQNSGWIGGKGLPVASYVVQAKFTARVPYVPFVDLKTMLPWINVVARADGTWRATGHV